MSTRHRLAAVWFADIVDYSGLAASDQGGAIRLVRVFQRCTRECVQRYGGHVVKFLGDGALVEFRSLQGAIAAADALRGSFSECLEEAGVGEQAIRIGIHSGEMVEADGDVYGDGVNVAARILDEAEPGEILVSDDAWRQVRQQTELEFEPLGGRDLQGVGEVGLHRLKRVGSIEPEAASSRTGLPGLWDEIQRRHVFRVAAAYVIVGVTVVQVVAAVFPPLNLPEWSLSLAVVLTIVGFPIAVVLAWAFEWTPEGVRRSDPGGPAAKAGRIAVAGVAIFVSLVVGWWVLDRGLDREVAPTEAHTAAVPIDPGRLGVLFLASDEDVRHVADGLTRGITDRLIGTDLEVVPSHAMERYRGAPDDSVAKATGAGLLVRGELIARGDSLLVRLQLVDAVSRTQLESWQVVRSRDEVFELRNDVVDDLAAELRTRLGKRIVFRARRGETESVEAWDLLQRAERLIEQVRAVNDPQVESALLREGDSILARAERLDPDWIEPTLARSRMAVAGGDSLVEDFQRAMRHVERAIETHGAAAPALALRGQLRAGLAARAADSTAAARYIADAESDLRRAVAVDPDLASAWIALAGVLYQDLWELPEALRAAKEAHEKDHYLLEEDHFSWLCLISMQLEDWNGAKRWCAEGRRRFPGKQTLIAGELTILASDGVEPDPKRAWALVDELSRVPGAEWNVPAMKMLVAAVLARAEMPDSARAVARRTRLEARSLFEDNPGLEEYVGYMQSRLHLLLGERERALDRLEAFLKVWPGLRAELARDYWFESLAGDPRFESLVDRRRLPIFCRLLCEPPET